MKRLIGVIATVAALAIIIVLAVYFGGRKPVAPASGTGQLTVVKGLVGSEKAALFNDPATKKLFRDAGYDVQVDTAGSRAQLSADPAKYDFFSPGSAPVADELAGKIKGREHPVFYSPLVVYSFKPVVDALAGTGLVKDGSTFDVAAYLDMLHKGTRWNQIPGIPAALATPKAVLVTTTDPGSSNSALMFASLTGYVANDNKILTATTEVSTVAPKIKPVFDGQGYTEASSEGPFQDYLALGAGKTPLLVGYESQLLQLQLAHDPAVTADMVTLQLSPGMITKHSLVTRTDHGQAVADLFGANTDLARQVARFGFRPLDAGVFTTVTKEAGVPAPALPGNAVEPSPYAILDQLVTAIKQ